MPAGSTLNNTTTLDFTNRNFLLVKSNGTNARKFYVIILRWFDYVYKRNAVELISLPLEPWFLSNLFEAASPGKVRCIEHALKRVTWYPDFLTVVSKQVLKALWRIVNAVASIVLDLFNRPIPDSSQ